MDLRALKKEVQSLPNVEENLKQFQDNWIKPLRTNTNSHLPFLKKLDPEVRLLLNKKLARFHEDITKIKHGQMINEKLNHSARYLIEMRLTELQGNNSKAKMIINRLLNDDFFNLKGTINEIHHFAADIDKLSKQYNEINGLLQKNLSLEDNLFFTELPHKKHLTNLIKISKKQKEIVHTLGKSFISLARK